MMDLKREIDPPYDLWPGIRGRIRAKRRWRVIGPIVGLAAAAAIVLIVVYRPRSVIDVTQVAPATGVPGREQVSHIVPEGRLS